MHGPLSVKQASILQFLKHSKFCAHNYKAFISFKIGPKITLQETWSYCISMGYTDDTFNKYAVIRKPVQYLSGKLFIFIKF
jgi:hypothetical protein